MEAPQNAFKVTPLTLTLTLILVAVGNVCCQDDLPHNFSAMQVQIDALTKARYLLFPHIYRAFIDAGRSPSRYNLSSGCQGDLTRYYSALNRRKAWAWRLYDATGKQGAGLFMGALTWKGNLGECLNTLEYRADSSVFSNDDNEPPAQYCSIILLTPQWLLDVFENLDLPFPVPRTPFIADVCVPASCTEEDLSHLVQTFVTDNSWNNVTFTVTNARCFKGRDISDDPAAICTALLLAVLAVCVGVGTAYDIYRRRRKVRVKVGAEYMIGYKKDTKQYGILKVVLAPPTKRQMRRRNTIGGYEHPDRYRLAEIKVDRQKLLVKGNTHDVTSVTTSKQGDAKPLANDVTSGAGPLQSGATPGFCNDVTSVTSSEQCAPTPIACDVTSHKESGAAETLQNDSRKFQNTPNIVHVEGKEKDNDLSVGNETSMVTGEYSDADRDSRDEKERDILTAVERDSRDEKERDTLTAVDRDEKETDTLTAVDRDEKERNTPTAVDSDSRDEKERDTLTTVDIDSRDEKERDMLTGVDRDEKETDILTAVDRDEKERDTLTAVERDSKDEKETDILTAVDRDEKETDILTAVDRDEKETDILTAVDRDEKDTPTAVDRDSRDEKETNKLTAADRASDRASKDTNAETAAALTYTADAADDEDNPDPTAELKTPLLLPNQPGEEDTRTELRDSRNLSVSDPSGLHTVFQDPDSAARAASEMEVEVPAPSPGTRSPVGARAPRSTPRTIKHTPAFSTQGSVFERQMSVPSDEGSLLNSKLGVDHTLYDIPEESAEDSGNGNGNLLRPEIVVRERPVKKAVGLLCSIVLSFSFRRSTKRVMAEGSPDTLFCLNGVRVLSIGWIVLGNVYMTLYLNPDVVDNHVDGVKLTQTLWVQAVINTTLAADSFYILSGTLGAYSFMKLKKNFKGKKMSEVMTFKEYFLMIFHRLIRIGPCYWLVLLLFTNLMPYLGKGPRWSYEITSVQTCKDKWWANALFFSNFYQADSMCMPHTYYLVNDFQFGLLMPLLMIPMLCMPEVGFMLLAAVVVVQILSTLIVNQGINGNVLRMQDTDYFSKVYVKPYCRMGVYAIGLGLGYILYVTKRQMKFRQIPLVVFWTLSLVVVVVLPYITFLENRTGGRNWSGMQTAMFEALSRPLWGLALAWIIYACSVGQGAFVNKLLSWNAFLPLCRITYGVYLLHPMLIYISISSRHNGFYINFSELTYEFVANVVLAYLLAFVLITFVESPFASLESNIRAHIGRRKKK